MADNNRLELDIIATDDTGPATAKARANFRSLEQDAAKAAAGMSKGFDGATVGMAARYEQATAQGIRSLEALERRAALAGKSVIEKLSFQRDNPSGAIGNDPKVIAQYQAYYDKIIAARRKHDEEMAKMDHEGAHGGNLSTMVLRRGFLAVKDFGEGRVQGTMAEAADILFGQGGTGGVVQKAIPAIAQLTGLSNGAVIAVGSLAAAFVGLGFAGIESMKGLAETGEEIKKFSLATGIAPTRVQAFQFAAKAAGADPSIVELVSREVSRGADDHSEEGIRKREQLGRLSVNIYDRFGELKPTEQVLLDIADGLDKLSPGIERNSAAVKIFGERTKDALPFLEGLRRNLATSDEIGNTLSEHDFAMMERWNDSLKKMGEEFHRFKLEVEVPLGIIGEVTLKGIGLLGMSGLGAPGTAYGKQVGEYINSHLFQQGEIMPPVADKDALRKIAEKDLADTERAKFLGMQRQDPAFRLNEEKKKLSEYQTLAQHGSVDDVQRAEAQFRIVRGLEQKSGKGGSNTALEGIVAARKQSIELDAKYAEIQASAEQKRLSASLNPNKELMSPDDITTRLKLAELTAIAQKDKEIESRRKSIDTKTGAEIDLTGTPGFQKFQAAEEATLPKRIRNEYATVLAEIEAQDARYFKARNDADDKSWEEAWQRRKKGELELQDEEIRTRQQIQTRKFDIDGQSIDRQKEMALLGLDGVNAQTLKEKISLEDQKLAIEDSYAERSLANQIVKLQNQEALAVAEIQKKAAESGNAGSDGETADITAKRAEYQQQIDAARGSTTDREIIDAQKAQGAKEKLQIESNRKVYDSLKHDAEGLFDQLVFHTKSWGDFAKDMFKATVLTPVKEIFSSQVAALFTKGLTGSDVTFGEVGNGQGTFGKLGGIFGRAGLGQPKFGDANHPLAKLNAPNHLGDVSLVSGAVPVVIINSANPMSPAAIATRAVQDAARPGWHVLPFKSQPAESVQSQGFDVQSTWQPLMSPISSISPNGFPTMGEIAGLGTPSGIFSAASDNPFVVPTAPPFVDQSLSGVQLADWTNANLGEESAMAQPASQGGFLSQIGQMFGLGGRNVKGTPPFVPAGASSGSASSSVAGMGGLFGGLKGMFGLNTSGTDMGGGVAIARTGLKGNLAAISKSSGFALLGGMAAMDGIRRGGALGTLEAAGGGAAVGFKYGGPIGAAIGAAIGGGLALAKTFGLFNGGRKHAKDLVKQIYGMDINNATADQIVAIAKQSYGNQIDVAVRSQQVRDLLKLYSQATGQKGAEDKFVQDTVHSASFSESGGRLFQNAVYDNGNAYAYSSPLATYGGVNTAPLQTYAPNNGVFSGNLQISLNGQSASNALAGQVVRVATPGFVQGQALAASGSSNGRTAQQNMALSPSALTR